MSTGLLRQALRRHPWSFLGTMITQCLAAVIITGSLGTMTSIERAPLDEAARQAVNASDVPDMSVVFLMGSIYLSMVIIGVTMTSAIGQQAKDIALVRTVGATPGRVRRAIALQAALVAIPAALAGFLLGAPAGAWWLAALRAHGLIPSQVSFQSNLAALPLVLGIALVTSVVGAMVAAIRPSRSHPAVALTETRVLRRGVGVRTTLGLIFVAAGAVLSIVIANLPAQDANGASFFTMLAMCVGSGLLAPVLVCLMAPLARIFGRTGVLAADNLSKGGRALSGALVALSLATGFAAVKVSMHTTMTHVNPTTESSTERWTDYAGTAVYVAFAAIAAVNTLATVVLTRRRDLAILRLAGGTKGHVVAVLFCEAVVVLFTALLVAVGITVAVTAPMLHATAGVWFPWLPFSYLVSGVAALALVVFGGMVLPAALSLRRPAVRVVAA